MVISTMTALMITCMAMYFTVLASRSTLYATFNQKQSYQSAISIYEMILDDAQAKDSAIRDKLLAMAEGNEIVAKGTDELLGDYEITIKRLPSEKDGAVTIDVFDIIIETKVKGVAETVHSQITYEPPTKDYEETSDPSVALAPTFAATGYVPNDVYLDKGHFRSDMYYDNEVTYFGAYDGSELFGYGDINCAGSVVMTDQKSMTLSKDNKPHILSVRNNLTVLNLSRDPGLARGSKVYVGGSMYQHYEMKNCDIYVNGDLYLYGGNLNDGSIRYFVNGNVYLYASQTPQIWCNGSIYDNNGNIRGDANKGRWNDLNLAEFNASYTDGRSDAMSYNDMLLDLDNRTQTTPYYKWTLPAADIAHHTTITVNSYNQPAYLKFNDFKTAEKKAGCTIDDIIVNGCDGGAGFIIIDTGDEEDNVFSLHLMANRNDSSGKKTLFSWTGAKGDNVHIRVLVKGRGSVIIEVDKDAVYQDTDDSILAHYNWWIMCGGQRPESYNVPNGPNNSLHLGPDTLVDFVHKDCGEKCGYDAAGNYVSTNDCGNYISVVETTKTAEEGGYCTREVITQEGHSKTCNHLKEVATCSKHGVSVEFCPDCERPYVYASIDSDGEDDFIICKDRVDKEAVLAYYNANKGKDWDTDSKGLVYPNSNIFLISSEESAQFSFGYRPDGVTPLSKNSMIGYVYAPYVTFYANTGGGANDAVKFMGGMTVSDYNFLSDNTFIMCKPDKNPTDLMDPESRGKRIVTKKDWKIELRTH